MLAAVAIGLFVAIVALLIAQGTGFSFTTPVLAVLAAVPYLLYARLAIRQPGAEAVVAGVLLLAVGSWGYVGAIDHGTARLVTLPIYLCGMIVVVFLLGLVLRLLIDRQRVRAR